MSSRCTRSEKQVRVLCNRKVKNTAIATLPEANTIQSKSTKLKKRRFEEDVLFEPDTIVTRAKKQSKTDSKTQNSNCPETTVFDSNNFVCFEEFEEETVHDGSEDLMELSAKESTVENNFHSFSSVSILAVNVHQDVIYKVHPTQWQILGFIDAEVTEKYIHGGQVATHKLCVHPNFERFQNNSRTTQLLNLVTDAYLQTLEYADIVPTKRFGENSSFTEMAVLSRRKVKSRTIKPGLKGFTAKISDEELLEDMSFSVFAPTNNFKHNRIMLGPASFINHDCDPNARFLVEGEKSASTVAIQTIKPIGAGEEITVSYGDNYFGENNQNCRCTVCKSYLDVTQPLFETFIGSGANQDKNNVSLAECNRGANQDGNNQDENNVSLAERIRGANQDQINVSLAECNRGANQDGNSQDENNVSLAECIRGANQDQINVSLAECNRGANQDKNNVSLAECNRGANQDENNQDENNVSLAECNRGANQDENNVSLAESNRGANQDENNLVENDQPVYPVIGCAEFEFVDHPVMGSEFDEPLDEESKQIQRIKTVKTDEVVECLICHVTVKRIDRHLKQHRDKISEKEERFLIDFYRTRNAPGNKKVYDCLNCYRRFVSLVTHRYKSKCDCTNVVRVENCASRR